MGRRNDDFLKALEGKKISPLTLDNKWHQLFDGMEIPKEIRSKADELNDLIQKQGNIDNEQKKIKSLKKKLLDEMVQLSADASGGDQKAARDLDQHKKLIEDCNAHIDDYQDQLLDFPRDIDRVNKELMLLTMDYCYSRLKTNSKEIDEISEWIDKFRVELKKQVVRKQDREISNHRLYSYMHDIFGADVIEIFDMEYAPQEIRPARKKSEDSTPDKK